MFQGCISNPVDLCSSRDSTAYATASRLWPNLVELDLTDLHSQMKLSKEELYPLVASYNAHIIPDIALRIELCVSYICGVPCHLWVIDSTQLPRFYTQSYFMTQIEIRI